MRPRAGVRLLCLFSLVIVASGLVGCPKRPVVVEAPPAPSGPPAPAVPAPSAAAPPAQVIERATPSPEAPAPTQEAQTAVPQPQSAPLQDVFFDFDRARLRPDQQKALHSNITWLKANPHAEILIEGHCDERGTPEYNIGLGQRRANAVRHQLIRAGIPAVRIAAVSYGKERPFVVGHDESAWKWNRRAHLVVLTR